MATSSTGDGTWLWGTERPVNPEGVPWVDFIPIVSSWELAKQEEKEAEKAMAEGSECSLLS